MLNTDGEVCECTGDNIFLVRGSRIVTPPVSAGLLNGVTRLFVMNEVAPACGIDVAERTLRLDDLFTADEIFLTGTAAEVIGVRSVNGTAIGEGRVGPITGRLSGIDGRNPIQSRSGSPSCGNISRAPLMICAIRCGDAGALSPPSSTVPAARSRPDIGHR